MNNQLNKLIEKAKNAATAYYSGKEIMSDSEYDALIEQIRYLDKDNPLIQGIASSSDEEQKGPKVKHQLITGTLTKCNNEEEFLKWMRLHGDNNKAFSIEFKCDGSGIELIYKKGELISAITRGNGFEGLEKIDTVKTYINLPKKIDSFFTGSIRGEMLIFKEDFKNNFVDMKNPRNATAGIINRKFSDLTEKNIEELKFIHFIAYDILDSKGILDVQQDTKLDFLKNNGFEIPDHWIFTNAEDILKKRKELIELRNYLPYEIDGIVVKPLICDKQDLKLACPKNCCAIKFDLASVVTRVLNIEWSLSGEQYCPIAIVDPVSLNGTTVKRASLSNLNIMRELDIRIGSLVEIVKGGEIIPKITKVVS